MARVSGKAKSLSTQLMQIATAQNLNIDMAAGRILAEAVLRHWPQAMGQAPILLKGGQLFDQRVRETRDADIVAVRHYLPHEIANGMRTIASLAEDEGIHILSLSGMPEDIDVGYGEPIQRWFIRGAVGGMRADTHIDLSVAQGPHAFSRAIEIAEIPSLLPMLPSLTIAMQPLEAAAAEKLLAVALQAETDFRVRHLGDVIDERLWDGVDCRDVAREMLRVCRHRGIDIGELPETLEWPAIPRLEAAWERYRAGKTPLSIFSAWIDAAYLWSQVQGDLSLQHRPFAVTRPVSGAARMSA